MRKIPTIFMRDESRRLVIDQKNSAADWVFRGDGVATQKHDGTCCLVRDGVLFRRYDLRPGKTPPFGFEAADGADEITGSIMGWVPVGHGTDDKWHREAVIDRPLPGNGTYELCGPRVQGNPEKLMSHHLIPHGIVPLPDAPTDFSGLRNFLSVRDIEGIVWHHPDGRMAKIKKRDFGFPR
jgi:hypothetical protein